MKAPSLIDVSVLILFFNRPEPLARVFEEVRKARPARLFLFQDGARGERDVAGIEACRRVVEQIDWECEVHRNYQTQNLGCDPAQYVSQKWTFSITDKCIMLEDDDVPSQSFFPFCKELLDRYEHDERISIISGYNIDEITPDADGDYFFTSALNIWGWASWRRVIDRWDGQYTALSDERSMAMMRDVVKQKGLRKNMIPRFYEHRDTGRAFYESIAQMDLLLTSSLSILPTKNMINNIGLMADSTHFQASGLDTMPKRMRKQFTLKRYETAMPLQHPKHVIENVAYLQRLYRLMAWNHPWIKMGYSIEELWYHLRGGKWKAILKAIKNRIQRGL